MSETSPAAPTPVPPLASLLKDQRACWRRGERIPAETYLLRHPSLSENADAALDLIANELLLRLERGERPVLPEYVYRFPQWSAQLKIQFELELAVEEAGQATEVPGGMDAH